MLFPQDKEDCDSVTSHEENWSVFSRSRRLPFQSTRIAFYTMWNHLRDSVSQQLEWNMRDSCGRKGLDETPQSIARGGLLAARGKRVYSSCGDRRGCFVPIHFPIAQLFLEIWKELLKFSTSIKTKLLSILFIDKSFVFIHLLFCFTM